MSRLSSRAFTLLEVLVAVAIISLVSSLAVVNIVNYRKNSRDSVRKDDVNTLLKAVDQYTLVNGSSWIKVNPQDASSCTLPLVDSANPSSGLDELHANNKALGSGCVGAGGRAFGMVNEAGSTVRDGNTTLDLAYADTSIVEALKNGKYLASTPKDPLNPTGTTSSASVRDYILIRACPDGRQHVGDTGSLYGIWTLLEGTSNKTEQDTMRNVPGGLKTSRVSQITTSSGPVDIHGQPFDYGLPLVSELRLNLNTGYLSNLYGVSNEATQPNATSFLSCKQQLGS